MTLRSDVNLDLGGLRDGARLLLPLHMLDTHCQVLAPTGYGKSRLLTRMAQEMALKTRDATVFIDPAGDCVNHLRRWAYEHRLDRRLVVIDPRERRYICGLNPVRPWTANRGLQAGVLRDVVWQALGANESSTSAPLAGQWIYNMMYALLECGLTMNELPGLLDYTDSTYRSAVVGRLKPSVVRNEFEWLAQAAEQGSPAQGFRLLNDQLGSTTRRLRQFVTNEYLFHMLAGQVNAIDWDWVIDHGKIVLVNLGLEGNALTEEDQRLLGQLVISSLIRHCFARAREKRRPVNLIIDEAGKLASPEVTTILNESRKFRLRLVLAHQTLSQLVNHGDGDTRLRDAVVNNARVKIVFGGLGAMDAADVGRTLYGHLLDPDKRKLELKSLTQLSRVEDAESVTEGRTVQRGNIRMTGSMRGSGRSKSSTITVTSGNGASGSEVVTGGTGVVIPTSLDDPTGGAVIKTDGFVYGVGASEFDGVADAQSEAESEFEAESESEGASLMRGRTRSVTRSVMVVPTAPFEVTTSVQFEPLEEQLYRFTSRMISQPDRHAVLAWGKLPPVEFRVVDVPEPRITVAQAHVYDAQVMKRLPCFATPEQIQAEIATRQQSLLRSAAVEVVDTESAIQRRRTARRASRTDDHQHADDTAVPGVVARVIARRPRSGGRAAPIVVDFGAGV